MFHVKHEHRPEPPGQAWARLHYGVLQWPASSRPWLSLLIEGCHQRHADAFALDVASDLAQHRLEPLPGGP